MSSRWLHLATARHRAGGSVGLTGTQGRTLIGACARTIMVRALHPGNCARGRTSTRAYMRRAKPYLGRVPVCAACWHRHVAGGRRRHHRLMVSSSWSHLRPFIVVAVTIVAVDLSSAPLHTTGARPGENPDWQRLTSDDLRAPFLRDVEDVTERIQVLLGHAHDEGEPSALGHGLGSWAGVHATISGADFGGVSFQIAAQPMPSLQNARPIRMGP